MKWEKAVLILSAVIALGGCNRASNESSRAASSLPVASNWRTFTPADKKFEISMPGVPTKETSVVDTALGPLDNHVFLVKTRQNGRKSAYMISYVDYPAGHTQKFKANDFLEQVWQGGFGNLTDSMVYKRNIMVDGFSCLEFQYKGGKSARSLVSCRNILMEDRLYQISAFTTNEDTQVAYATQFLESFKMLP